MTVRNIKNVNLYIVTLMFEILISEGFANSAILKTIFNNYIRNKNYSCSGRRNCNTNQNRSNKHEKDHFPCCHL